MMDITKSREEFEKWLEEVHGLYGEDIDWEPERNCYRIFGIHLSWCAWQAARESIVIDLPQKISEFNKIPDNGAILLEAVNYDEAIDDCAEAIRAAGIRIKGESERIENKAPPKIENHMSQPIAVLDISRRTKNAILNGGISTIGDLLRIGHLGVLRVPGIGRGCEAEIKSALANLSIEWKPWGESE